MASNQHTLLLQGAAGVVGVLVQLLRPPDSWEESTRRRTCCPSCPCMMTQHSRHVSEVGDRGNAVSGWHAAGPIACCGAQQQPGTCCNTACLQQSLVMQVFT